jgi:hypothetical protein
MQVRDARPAPGANFARDVRFEPGATAWRDATVFPDATAAFLGAPAFLDALAFPGVTAFLGAPAFLDALAFPGVTAFLGAPAFLDALAFPGATALPHATALGCPGEIAWSLDAIAFLIYRQARCAFRRPAAFLQLHEPDARRCF